MRRAISYIALLAMTVCAASCDEGRIYPTDSAVAEEGGSVHLTAETTGLDTWTSGYTLAVAGFADGNNYALVSKNVITGSDGGQCDVVLSGIPQEVTTIELCALDRLRRRVATFHTSPYSYSRDTQELALPATDISMEAAVQREIFNTTCVNCHGGSNFAAAGLDLTEGKSHDALVMRESVKMPELSRVKPGESESSVLYLILDGDLSADWNYDHSVEVVRSEKLGLIRDWIDGMDSGETVISND